MDASIKIVKADKGNSSVVIDSNDYNNKVIVHLSDECTYTRLDSNPTVQLLRKVNSKIKILKDSKQLHKDEYDKLYVNKPVTPRFYATIKTHKENFPIRPIVSFIDSPTY